ncbi:MAG: glycine cleavage system protein H [Deltaproteobacteria bacterium]|nr:glycine cleavage system protein H [Deltaproteobacteria bacterium]MBW1949942.1 glycine cleavage system protein H [Deltaproteobacteria bacterium]
MKTTQWNHEAKEKRAQSKMQSPDARCVWMKAGIVNFRMCDHDFDCLNCPFDRSMRAAMDAQTPLAASGPQRGWAQEMRSATAGRRKPCVYFLAGDKGAPEDCARDYQCDDCLVEMELGYKRVQDLIVETKRAGNAASVHTLPEGRLVENRGGVMGFQVVGNECVWMKAGIVNFKDCDNQYDCYHCEFDRNMREAMEEKHSRIEGRNAPGQERSPIGPIESSCIHALAGRKDAPQKCEKKYQCFRCTFHQSISARRPVQQKLPGTPRCIRAGGYSMAEGYYFHFGHTWVQVVHGECVRVGMDDFIGKILGEPDGLNLPEPGMSVQQAQIGWSLSCEGRQATVLSPLTGRVLVVNRSALESPEVVREDPYGRGWLFQLEPSFLKLETQGLFYGEEGFHWMEHETRKLLELLGPDYGNLASTGGQPVHDVAKHFPQVPWDKLVTVFLRTAWV